MTATYTEPPEALGPGTDNGDGSISYGVLPSTLPVIPPRRDHAEIEREQAAVVMGCPYCDGIPATAGRAGSGPAQGRRCAAVTDYAEALEAIEDAQGRELERVYQDQAEAERRERPDRPRWRPGEAYDRFQRALPRIRARTYVPEGQYSPARSAGGQFASICSALDELGLCSARYHAPGCSAVTLQAAATGGKDEAEAWGKAVRRGSAASQALGEVLASNSRRQI